MVVVFGTGYWANRLIFYEDEFEIKYFIDNDISKQQNQFWGYEVKSPDTIAGNTGDTVIITSKNYCLQMKQQLMDMGIREDQIINAWDYEIFHDDELPAQVIEPDSPLLNVKVRNIKDYETLQFNSLQIEIEQVICNMVLKSKRTRISYPGRCQVCKKNVSFLIDNLYSGSEKKVNLRERLVCPYCWLNNRQRVMARLVLDEIPADRVIYLAEQVTPVYQVLKNNYKNLIGSEYLGNDVEGGTLNGQGIRHEDISNLSFGDEELDCVVTNDVLEHVADIKKTLKEIYRVLKQNGLFYATFPINFSQEETIMRAKMDETGKIEHFLEPVYHGNPINDGGSLVFYDYGWDFISFVKEAGFSDAYFIPFYSIPYGNIGTGSLYIFIARK